jgi:hypothetical protein
MSHISIICIYFSFKKGGDSIKIFIGKIQKYSDDYYRVLEYKTVTAEAIQNGDSITCGSSFMDIVSGRESAMRGIDSNEKLAHSIARTRSTVFEIMLCNPWEYFATFTLNSNYERSDIEVFRRKFTVWLQNYNARNSCKVKYLFIPELHKDGINWHGHGAIMGLPLEHLTKFKRSDKIPAKMKKLINAERELFNWNAYADKFGFVSLEQIRSREATAKYLTKYITKSISRNGIEVNKRLFYASKGLKRSEVLHEGEILREYIPDYENDYVKIRTYSTLDEALALFTTKGGK